MVTSRKRVAKRTTASRTAQLEEKLDDLVSILRATQQQQQQHHQHHQHQPQPQPQQQHLHHLQPQQPPPAAQSPMNGGVSNGDIPSSASSSSNCQPYVSRLDSLADAATTSQSQPRSSTLCGITITPRMLDSDRLPEPTPTEAEVYLVKFRQWLEFFPFMRIDPDLTAEALHREHPFLWLCIMNVTSMSMPQQAVLRERIRQEVAQRMVVNHERSLEMIQGLIVLTSWYV